MILLGNDFSAEGITYMRQNAANIGIELTCYGNPQVLDNTPAAYDQTTEILQGFSRIAMHGAYLDLFYASKDPLIREVAKTRTLQSLQAAAYHSIKHIVFHSSYRKFFDGHSPFTIDNFFKTVTGFWHNLESHIPDGATIYLENVEEDNPEILLKLIESINSPKIRCCLDVGHTHCNSDIPLADWISTLAPHIGYVHLHDNDGTADQHLPLGEGNLPIAETIRAILAKSSRALFVLECDIPKSVKYLVTHGILADTTT